MLMMISIFLLTFIVSLIIIMITIMMSQKSNKEREKMTPFECGFSPFKKARNPFSIRFFTVTLIFLIFDIEIALLLPLGLLMKLTNTFIFLMLSLMITLILLFGLLYEWKKGMLNWI